MNHHPHEPPQVLRCRGTADFLAALPQLTGFTAEDSLFVVLFSGAQAERAIRFDLPSEDAPESSLQLFDVVCNLLRDLGVPHDPAAAPAFVICTSMSFAQTDGAPWRRFARRFERRLTREHIAVRELCCIAQDGWVSFLDPSAPQNGHPLSEIAASHVALERRVHGDPIPDLASLGEIPSADTKRTHGVARALKTLVSVAGATAPSCGPASDTPREQDCVSGIGAHEVPPWFDNTAEVTAAVRDDTRELSVEMTARLIHCAANPDRWLLLALGIVTRPEFPTELASDMSARPFTGIAIDLDAESDVDSRPGWSIRRVLAAISPEFSEHRRLHGIRDRLIRAISEAPNEDRPALLALSSWIWWLGGNQTVAHRHAQAALDIAPGHEMSLMMQRMTAVPLYTGLLLRSQALTRPNFVSSPHEALLQCARSQTPVAEPGA